MRLRFLYTPQANKKVTTEDSELDKIVAELSIEMAADADKKIADWMRGNVDAADVVTALTKKAEAESKFVEDVFSHLNDKKNLSSQLTKTLIFLIKKQTKLRMWLKPFSK